MSDVIDYAAPTSRALPPPLWQRLTLIPLYYVGWAVGCAVWLTYLSILSANAVRAGSANVGVAYISLAACGIASTAVAYVARRRRWPQVLLAVLAVPATSFAVYAVIDMHRSPRGFLWDFFFRVVLILLVGALGLLLAGVAGIVLTRRRQGGSSIR